MEQAEYEHLLDEELAHEHVYHEDPVHELLEHESVYGSQRHMLHDVEDHDLEEPSWRDDKYHAHTGFDLRRNSNTESPVENKFEEDGVEHFDNERLHQSYGSSSPVRKGYGQFNEANGGGGCNFWDVAAQPVNGGHCNQGGCPCATSNDCCQDMTDSCVQSTCDDGWCQAHRFENSPVNGGGGCGPIPYLQ